MKVPTSRSTTSPEEQPDADATGALIEAAGRRAVLVPGDLRTRDVCTQVVEAAVAGLGGLDILVNNAGYHWARGPEGLDGLDPDEMDRVLRTNLHAVFWLCQAARPAPRAGRASSTPARCRPTNPPSSSSTTPPPRRPINNLTVNLAADLGPAGIRVNAVAPGPIWTPLQPATRPAEYIETLGAHTPLGRAGQPAEVAPAFVFLASPADASYVSGTVLGVTGGEPVF